MLRPTRTKTTGDGEPVGVGAADRLLDMIELLADQAEGMALSDIARRLDIAKSATHRLLTSLVKRGYVEQSPDRDAYRLSLKVTTLGLRFVARFGLLDICQPVLDRLAEQTGELVRLALASDGGLTWAAKAQGARFGLRYDPDMGSPVVLHATASGRAWLLALPGEEARAMVEARGFAVPERFSRRLVTSWAELAAELERTRARGYGLAVDEGEPGTAAIAIAIPARPGERPPGTISVAGPLVRMSAAAIDDIARHLRGAVDRLGELWPAMRFQGIV